MTIFTELERLLGSEVNLINDATIYNFSGAMATIKDWGNVTLASAGILLIKFNLYSGSAGVSTYARIKVGSIYVYAKRTSSTSSTVYGCAVYLNAGTYDILAEGATLGGITSGFGSFQCGFTKFNDLQASTEAAYSGSIALTVTSRVTPLGALNQAVYLVQCMAYTPAAVTNFENVGDNLPNGVSVTIDGAQKNWSERDQDADSIQASGARLALPFAVGSSHTVAISKRNANTVVNISVIACPWILGDVVHTPITFNFSQGSTIYASFEPLFLNPTKFAAIGMPRAITFGAADDYYSSSSAVDIMLFTYTLDLFDIYSASNFFFVNGTGGCITLIGVDMR